MTTGGLVAADGLEATGDVTVGDSVGAGVNVSGGTEASGCAVTTDGFVWDGVSICGGADGTTVTVGICDDGSETTSGAVCGFGLRPPGSGGLTGVVVGSVGGSANAGVMPPLSAVNEISVPVANATNNPRPR